MLLAKPLTFMNASGEAVGALPRYFKIEPADLLVVVDEVQLPLGEAAGAGARVGGRAQRAEVDRSRTSARSSRGCGSASDAATTRRDLADHVLARFDADEAAEVERMTTRAADAAEMFITSGIEAVMNGFNGGDPATTE